MEPTEGEKGKVLRMYMVTYQKAYREWVAAKGRREEGDGDDAGFEQLGHLMQGLWSKFSRDADRAALKATMSLEDPLGGNIRLTSQDKERARKLMRVVLSQMELEEPDACTALDLAQKLNGAYDVATEMIDLARYIALHCPGMKLCLWTADPEHVQQADLTYDNPARLMESSWSVLWPAIVFRKQVFFRTVLDC